MILKHVSFVDSGNGFRERFSRPSLTSTYQTTPSTKPQACVAFGDMLTRKSTQEEEENVKRKVLMESTSFYRKACEMAENPRGCFMMGMRYVTGEGVDEKDPQTSMQIGAGALDKACEHRHPAACFTLAKMLMKGQGVKRNRVESFRTFTKSCALGHMSSCANAGALIYYGVGTEKDAKAAALLCDRACDGGQQSSCELLKRIYKENPDLKK